MKTKKKSVKEIVFPVPYKVRGVVYVINSMGVAYKVGSENFVIIPN